MLPQRTLGELLAELRARLGFINAGLASKANEAKLISFLQEAHDYVFGELEPPSRRARAEIAMVSGSRLYDWHDDALDVDIDAGRVTQVWLKDGETLSVMPQGIDEAHRIWTTWGQPMRYDMLADQMEVWPTPDLSTYKVVVEYQTGRMEFVQLEHRPSVPDRLVFLYALALAKADYRHPDAQASAKSFENMLAREKLRQRGTRRYIIGVASDPAGPQVVKTNSGYRLAA